MLVPRRGAEGTQLMVVEARDIPGDVLGFAEDASEAIPQDDVLEFPDGVDSTAPSDVADDEAAASASDDLPVDDATLARYRAHLQPEFDRRLAEFQSIKDREVANERRRAGALEQRIAQLEVREQTRQAWLEQYFEQNALDPRDLAVLDNSLVKAERQVTVTAQQASAAFRQADAEIIQNHERYLREFGVDRNDPDVARGLDQLRRLVHRHTFEEGGREGTQLHLAAVQAASNLKLLMKDKQLSAKQAAEAAQLSQAAQRQARAKATQAKRGPQAAARAGGAAPAVFDPATVASKAWELYPNDERARLDYVSQQRAMAQPARR